LSLGVSYSKAEDGKSFTNALYGNGPGYLIVNGTRPDMIATILSKFYEFNCYSLRCRGAFLSAWHKLYAMQTPHLVVMHVTARN